MEIIDLKLKLFAGEPIFAEGFGDIYPLKVRDIIKFGYTDYLRCLNIITLELSDFVNDVNQLKDEDINVLDFLILFGGEEVEKYLQKAFSLFLNGDAIIDKKKLLVIIKREKETLIVNRNNYKNIQEVIKWQNYINNFEEKSDDFKPANERAKKFKERLELLKRKIEKAKKKKSNDSDDGNDGIDFYDILSSISSKSYSVNEINILDMTIYQVYRKLKRMQIIDQYDVSIKSMLAGAKNIKLKHWSSKM